MGVLPQCRSLLLLVLWDNRQVCQQEDWVVAAWGDKAGMLVLGH